MSGQNIYKLPKFEVALGRTNEIVSVNKPDLIKRP